MALKEPFVSIALALGSLELTYFGRELVREEVRGHLVTTVYTRTYTVAIRVHRSIFIITLFDNLNL